MTELFWCVWHIYFRRYWTMASSIWPIRTRQFIVWRGASGRRTNSLRRCWSCPASQMYDIRTHTMRYMCWMCVVTALLNSFQQTFLKYFLNKLIKQIDCCVCAAFKLHLATFLYIIMNVYIHSKPTYLHENIKLDICIYTWMHVYKHLVRMLRLSLYRVRYMYIFMYGCIHTYIQIVTCNYSWGVYLYFYSGAWWRSGRVDAFRPKDHGFDFRSSRHVGTLGKSFTHSCLWCFGVKLGHSIRAVSGNLWVVVDLKSCYRNGMNEWMN